MKKPLSFLFLFSLLMFTTTYAGMAQTDLKIGTRENPYFLPQYHGEIKIDGKLNENAWQHALKIPLPYETDPGENTPAPVKTDAYLFHDHSYLYVGFLACDPEPEKIRARHNDRDDIWDDDYVAIFLDTFNDERRAFAFRSNPLGVQSDDIRLPNSSDISWDAIYESKGKISENGYTIEMAIPLNQLRFQRTQDDQVWGINLMRVYPRNLLHCLEAIPIDRNNDSFIAQFIKINGFKNVKPGKNIELVPSVIAEQTDIRPDFPNGKMENSTRDFEAGLSARWSITSNLTLNGTINPDFSQVEADAYLLDINEPFALNYPEKRPFFQEGSDYFSTLKDVVYTRILREPGWGMKLTGKAGKNTIGGYVVQDELTNFIIPGTEESSSESLDRNNTATVLRYKRDLGNRLTFGLMATNREGKDYFNRLAGMDGDIRITNSDRVQFQILGSSTHYPDEISDNYEQNSNKFNDYFIAFEYDHNARNWGYWLDYDDVGPGFRADLGFIPMVGYRNVEGGINYTWYGKPASWWSRFILSSEMNYYEDYSRTPIRKSASMIINYSGDLQSHAHFGGYVSDEVYNGRKFDLTYFTSCFGFWPTRDIWFHTHFTFGDRIDYDNTRLGKRFRVDPEIGLNIGKHFQFELYHLYERMTAQDADLYTANISQFSIVYYFNVRVYLRSIIQYVNYDYNVDNYTEDRNSNYKELFTQLLFSYKINPFTVFFLGYSDNHLGSQMYNLIQQNRTLFMKLSYAWVL